LLSGALARPALAANNPVPFVDVVSPVSITRGATGVALKVGGTGFVATSAVVWNAISLPETTMALTGWACTISSSSCAKNLGDRNSKSNLEAVASGFDIFEDMDLRWEGVEARLWIAAQSVYWAKASYQDCFRRNR
jgi:hypothetical protein